MLTVKGPKGTLAMQMRDEIVKYDIADDEHPRDAGQRRQAGARLLGHAAHAWCRTSSPA